MSESRKECYECLNNKRCTYRAMYNSIYCKNNRRYREDNIKHSEENKKKK